MKALDDTVIALNGPGEHDATDELMPMLDIAHSIFNALTGTVSGRDLCN